MKSVNKQHLIELLNEMSKLEKLDADIAIERNKNLKNISIISKEIQITRILLGQLGMDGAIAPLFEKPTDEVEGVWVCKLKNRIDDYADDIKKLIVAKDALWVLDRKEYIKTALANIDREIDTKHTLRSILEEELRLGTIVTDE